MWMGALGTKVSVLHLCPSPLFRTLSAALHNSRDNLVSLSCMYNRTASLRAQMPFSTLHSTFTLQHGRDTASSLSSNTDCDQKRLYIPAIVQDE